ncbi:hypothetical protein K7X08_019692 [Anisodus acutangulus]|uniref:Uncharacterized protein n=1 Tax=Anisodus acutangulus TaxID=402998 RepID=A0A9Q1MT07_9SOLA|nr:hypothetical protein K7X08_019692 [Anisodus acutangulus]
MNFSNHGLPKAAAELKMPAVEFISSSSTMTAYMLHAFKKPGIKFPFSSIYYHDDEKTRIEKQESSTHVEKLEEDKKRVRDCFYLSCDIVLIIFFKEIEDLLEIAYGLENSKVNFIWPIRFQKGEDLELEEALPKEFFNRVKVFKGCPPQAKILDLSTIGRFMNHCGWSSVMESMKYGVPIIAMPMHIDQPINSRLVEDVGVAVEVVRDSNGSFIERKLQP